MFDCPELGRLVSRFARKEHGSVTVLTLFTFLMMLLVAGMAVDLMRFETRRTALQNTIDSAVLSAANLSQTTDPDTLVRDFFAKSGYDGAEVVVDVSEDRIGDDVDGTLVGRSVSAELDLDVNTYFMGMLGIDELSGASAGRATESIQSVEISLVLDISGSMGGSKIQSLKTAAKNFTGIVMGDAVEPGSVSISIVPYNHTVVVPEFLLDALNTQSEVVVTSDTSNYANPAEFTNARTSYYRNPPSSRCVQFTDDQMVIDNIDDYMTIRALNGSMALDRLGYFDENGKSSGPGGSYDRPADDWNRFCDPTRSEILVHETNVSLVNAAIDGLSADGWTSIDMGMRWGVGLLDPGLRPVINGLVDADVLDDAVENRPGDYIGTETMKVVVLMTDGENTVQRDLKPAYFSGPSRVWFSPTEAGATFDMNDDDYPNYWDGFYIRAGNEDDSGDSYHWYQVQEPWDRYDGLYHDRDELPEDAYQLTYDQLYNRFSESAVSMLFRDRAEQDDNRLDNLWNAHKYAVYEPNTYGELDRRLNGSTDESDYGVCDAAKVDNDIIVFTIAFSAPAGGETQMRRCATADGYYFDADSGAALDEAFRAIAGQITKLRLTQ